MRFLRKNRFSDSRFTGKKFLKAERGKFLKKMGMCDIPNSTNCYNDRNGL